MAEIIGERLLRVVTMRSEAVGDLERQTDSAREKRDRAVRTALEAKVPIASIARAANLSRQAVYDIRDATNA